MAEFFVLVSACVIIFNVGVRILQARFAGTSFGAALAYIH